MKPLRVLIVAGTAILLLLLGLPNRDADPAAWASAHTFQVTWQGDQEVWVSDEIISPLTQVGLTWSEDSPSYIAVRTLVDGVWGPWQSMSVESDHGPDVGTSEYANQISGTDLLWVEPADGVQFLVRGVAPSETEATVIDTTDRTKPLSRRVDDLFGSPDSAQGDPGQPLIHPRSEWDPSNSCQPKAEPGEVQVTHAFVHHTTGPNDYTDAAARVLAICLFHTGSRGWDDIGYNFLIDRFGQIWEGRAGGIDRGVQGAHTAGFNSYSTGIAFIGDHVSTAPSSAAQNALVDLLAWKFGVHNVEPTAISTLVSKGSSLWPLGKPVALNPISGHLDAQATACPGAACYNLLPSFRSAVDGLWDQDPISTYTDAIIGDFDGDGTDEGAIFSSIDGRIRVTQPYGTQSIWTGTFSPASGWSHFGGDFDGDGKTDLAHYFAGNGTWWVSRSTGSSFTTTKWSKEFSPWTGWLHIPGDFDGDGRTDIAHYYGGNGTWWVSRSTGSSFTTTKWSKEFLPATGWQHLTGDFNGDGATDIAHYYGGNGTWWVSRSTGSAFTTTKWSKGFLPATGWQHLTGDFNGDGATDIAHYYRGNGTWWVSAATGSSTFATSLWATTPTYDHLSLMFSRDADDDGDDEIFFFDAFNGFLTRLSNLGGSFGVASIDTPWRTTLGYQATPGAEGDQTMVYFGQEFEWLSLNNLDSTMSATSVASLPRP